MAKEPDKEGVGDSMVSMKMSKADVKAEQAPMEATLPEYPWGLCLHLDSDQMEKLGMDMPKVGDVLEICAKVRVTRTEESAAEGSPKEHRSVNLQITDMEIE